MKEIICPQCSEIIPEYRWEDPYCDCGWEPVKKVDSFDAIGWILTFCYLVVACMVQVVLVFVLHYLGSLALSFLANVMVAIIDPNLIYLVFNFLFVLLDFVMLSLFYGLFIYFMARKSSKPVRYSTFIGLVLLAFKIVLIDPRSGNPYILMLYIQNLLLLGVTVGSGYFISYNNKLTLDRFKSGGKMS